VQHKGDPKQIASIYAGDHKESQVEQHTVQINFPDATPDVANTLAESLGTELRQDLPRDQGPIQADVVRTDPQAQDFGTTLVLLLGTPVLLALANAVRDWAKRKDQGSIEINGVRINNVASKDAADIIRAIKQKPAH
jgi:hypothetical protein